MAGFEKEVGVDPQVSFTPLKLFDKGAGGKIYLLHILGGETIH